MKTIKFGETLKRVSDSESENFIKNGWKYVAKSEWKKTRLEIVETKSTKNKSKK